MSFTFDGFRGTGRTFSLRGERGPVVLSSEGLQHPKNARSRRDTVLTRWADLTHLTASPAQMWIGARDSVYILPRAHFVDENGPERLISAVLSTLANQPGGPAQLERMAAVEQLSQSSPTSWATRTLIGVCVAIFAAQIVGGYPVDQAGLYSAVLVADGDIWRLITANLLHASPGILGFIHIGFNLLAILGLGTLLERPLGGARTGCVMAVAGVGSMLASGWFGDSGVVGASGIAFGLAGGVLWIDYRRPEELPAWWRFPRRSLAVLVAVNSLLGLVVPFIAMAAHMGGFVAGVIATALFSGRVASKPPLWVRSCCVGVVVAVVLSVGLASQELFREGDMSARYAARYARLPGVDPYELNNLAWLIAISEDPSPAELDAALRLAERAVSETNRDESTILDTLAEVHFVLGDVSAALRTIDEAIEKAPNDRYFSEQRRRYTGERSREDRPEHLPSWLQRSAEPAPTDTARGQPS